MPELIDKINDISLASIDQWGVQMHNDYMWELIHNIFIAHDPSRNMVVENHLIGIEKTGEMIIDEVHGNLVDQKLVPCPLRSPSPWDCKNDHDGSVRR